MSAASRVPAWLASLPVAPEYRPSLSEFEDPIAYILKIEPEASRFGICKIVPPLPPLPRPLATDFLEASFAANNRKGIGGNAAAQDAARPTFTTRRQQVGLCPRRSSRPAQRTVWHSGQHYTLAEFEAKAGQFRRNYLRKCGIGVSDSLGPLDVESLFWGACESKPFSVEYANDMPGSGFQPMKEHPGKARNVGETSWNMRHVARAEGSLLSFMREEVPGVTSPMLYVAMLFSWFAWHIEDHELHSLNFLHFGASKTWYGVPRDASLAFEDVVRVHGYRGEVNPLVTFTLLNEKTTVISPDVLLSAGIPCCRLVQNAGEFVITFPGSYHCGFSHGFNCGEASNIATPLWLRVANEAAIRRASTNCPPMVSHQQLLYALALSLSSSAPKSLKHAPEGSRLHSRKNSEPETMVKKIFVDSVAQNNKFLQMLNIEACITIPRNAPLVPSPARMKACVKPVTLTAFQRNERQAGLEVSNVLGTRGGLQYNDGRHLMKSTSLSASLIEELRSKENAAVGSDSVCSPSHTLQNTKGTMAILKGDELLHQGLLTCVQCGILNSGCAAIVEPNEASAIYFASTKFLSGNDQSNTTEGTNSAAFSTLASSNSVKVLDTTEDSTCRQFPDGVSDQCTMQDRKSSALDLLCLAYDASDSEDDETANPTSVLAGACNTDSSSPSYAPVLPFSCTDISYSGDLDAKQLSNKQVHGGIGDVLGNYLSKETTGDWSVHNCKVADTALYDKDSRRMHLFCLEHALEVKERLQNVGGANIMGVCHSEYPKVEAQAKAFAEELCIEHHWTNTSFSEATEDNKRKIGLALEDEEAIPTSSDWAVKMGINLYYSSSLCKSPNYSKQLPFNAVIYRAFGREPPEGPLKSPKQSSSGKKTIAAGKWCGKVWRANQLHPLIAQKLTGEDGSASLLQSDQNAKIMTTYRRRKQAAVCAGAHPEILWRTEAKETEVGSMIRCTSSGREVNHEQDEMLNQVYSDSRSNPAGSNTDDASESSESRLKDKDSCSKRRKPAEIVGHELLTSDDTPSFVSRKKRRECTMRSVLKMEGADQGLDDISEDAKFSRNKMLKTPSWDRKRRRDGAKRAANPSAGGAKGTRGETSATTSGNAWSADFLKEEDETWSAEVENKPKLKRQADNGKLKKACETDEYKGGKYLCDFEGCEMSFRSKGDLALHKKNICPVTGCRKKFISHKYLVQHAKVHKDDRPLKCPWKGCNMAFKWPWARTEHLRVHTGVRPYVCMEPGCGQTFRFVSDSCRHKRTTGHSLAKVKKGK